eukprot:5267798-Lingulodinium_polyedra.AAC.1
MASFREICVGRASVPQHRPVQAASHNAPRARSNNRVARNANKDVVIVIVGALRGPQANCTITSCDLLLTPRLTTFSLIQ